MPVAEREIVEPARRDLLGRDQAELRLEVGPLHAPVKHPDEVLGRPRRRHPARAGRGAGERAPRGHAVRGGPAHDGDVPVAQRPHVEVRPEHPEVRVARFKVAPQPGAPLVERVVVSGDRADRDVRGPEAFELRPGERGLGASRRHRVEQVARDQHHVDALLDRQRDDVRERLLELLVLLAAARAERLERRPEMDVGGVQDPDAHLAAAANGQI